MSAAVAIWLACGIRLTIAGPSLDGEYLIDAWQSDEGLPQGSVVSLVQTRDGYVWAGTFGGLARFDGVRFEVFDTSNTPELPANSITALFEAHDGALLVCTGRGGLACLAGGRFRRLLDPRTEGDEINAFVSDPKDGTYLGSVSGLLWHWANGQINLVVKDRLSFPLRFGSSRSGLLRRDSQGTFWTVSARGDLLRLVESRWQPQTFPPLFALGSCRVVAQDGSGDVWLGTTDGPAFYRLGSWHKIQDASEDMRSGGVDDAFSTRSGDLWLMRWAGNHSLAWRITPGANEIQACRFSAPSEGIFPIGEDPQGGLCLGSLARGFLRVSRDGKVTKLERLNGLPGNSVRCYLLDAEGNEWLGLGDGGLVRLKKATMGALHQDAHAFAAVHSVCEDQERSVWVATTSEGVFRVKGRGLSAVDISGEPELSYPLTVLADHRNQIWVGTFSGGAFCRKNGKFEAAFEPGLVGGRVRAIYEDSRGRLWLGCRLGLACYQDGKLTVVPAPSGVVDFEVQSILEEPGEGIWAGTRGSGLGFWNGSEWRIFRAAQGLGSDNVLSFCRDSAGFLWIGTTGGLNLWQAGGFVRISTRNGLPDDAICYISEDQRGNLWFSSSQGVFKAARTNLLAFVHGTAGRVSAQGYGRADGLPTRECSGGTQPSGWKTGDGRLLFATIKGVAEINPQRVTSNPNPPPVFIEDVRVDGKRPNTPECRLPAEACPMSSGVSLEVPPGARHLTVRYTALSFTAPDKVRFRTKLEPSDSEWVEMGGRREIDYAFVRPGRYRFSVIACNNDGVWNSTGAEMTIRWRPRFWQTGWFMTAWILALVGGAAAGVGLAVRKRHRFELERVSRLRAVENERARIARDIHDDLGSSLTEINLLSALALRDATPLSECKTQVTRIMARAQELSQTLDETVWALNPRNDWLKRLATYMCHFAKEFLEPTPIRCRLEIADDLPDFPLSADARHNIYLLVKEALNNAVRHSGATEVELRMRTGAEHFVLQIADNGRGLEFEETDATGNGLRNMAQRAEQAGGEFALTGKPGAGTTVTFKLRVPPNTTQSPAASRVVPTQTGDPATGSSP